VTDLKTQNQKKAALINQIGSYLNTCRPPIDATTQQSANVIGAFNELVKPIVDQMNAEAEVEARLEKEAKPA